MAYSQRQETNVNVGVYVYNGDYRPFKDWPISLQAWNVGARAEIEFQGGKSVVIALDGYEYSNAEGYRLYVTVEVDNIYNVTDQLLWKALFDLLAGQYDKLFATPTTNNTGSASTSLQFSTATAPATDDYYNGLVIQNATGSESVITDYTGSSRTATLQTAISWANATAINVIARPNLQRVIGLAINDDGSDRIYYNLDGNAYGVNRQFTIGKAIVNIKLRSVDRYSTIPQSYVLNG